MISQRTSKGKLYSNDPQNQFVRVSKNGRSQEDIRKIPIKIVVLAKVPLKGFHNRKNFESLIARLTFKWLLSPRQIVRNQSKSHYKTARFFLYAGGLVWTEYHSNMLYILKGFGLPSVDIRHSRNFLMIEGAKITSLQTFIEINLLKSLLYINVLSILQTWPCTGHLCMHNLHMSPRDLFLNGRLFKVLL